MKTQQVRTAPAPSNPNFIPPRLRCLEPENWLDDDGQMLEPPPAREWAVPGWIPKGQVTLLYGDGSTGKSILAVQLMTAAVMGGNWLGLPVERACALGYFSEDSEAELKRRQAAILHHYGATRPHIDGALQLFSGVAQDNALATFESRWSDLEPTGLYDSLRGYVQDLAGRAPGRSPLIVLDSLYDLFAGDQNETRHVRRFITLLGNLARETDGTVVVTAHPSRSGRADGSGESGSVAWNNACRSRLYLQAPSAGDGEIADPDVRTLTRMKSNYGARGQALELRWQTIDLWPELEGDRKAGVFVLEAAQGGTVGFLQRTRAEAVFLECLDALEKQGRNVTHTRQAGNFAPKVMQSMAPSKGVKPRDLERAMNNLFERGDIRVEKYGRPSEPRHRIVRGEGPSDG